MFDDDSKVWTAYELDVVTMTNLYLFAREESPKWGYHEALMREEDLTIQVDAVTYMQQAGRFALPSMSSLIQNFMNGNIPTTVERQEFSVGEMIALVEGDQRFSYVAYNYQDGYDDYNVRAYVWGSQLFKINDDAKFVIESDGSRHIENLIVRPFDDNFDFKSDDFITSIGNPILESSIDRGGLGRKVNIEFTDFSKNSLPSRTYSYEDFLLDQSNLQQWHQPVEGLIRLPFAMAEVVGQIVQSGVTWYERGLAIRYGSSNDDNMVAPEVADADFALYNANGGAKMYAGNGDDIITGSSFRDFLHGGDGEDEIFGGDGDDEIYAGTVIWGGPEQLLKEDDKVYGGSGNDSIWGLGGDDQLSGQDGNDHLYGGPGDDYLIGGTGNNMLDGGIGNDVYIIEGEFDLVTDADDGGQIFYHGKLLSTTARQKDPQSNVFTGDDGNRYLLENDYTVLVNNNLRIFSYDFKNFGLNFEYFDPSTASAAHAFADIVGSPALV